MNKLKFKIENGILYVSEDSGCSWEAIGEVVSPGQQGPQGEQGEPGEQGEDGQDGTDGKDGFSPYIDQDGFWVTKDGTTEYKAAGTTYTVEAASGDHMDEVSTVETPMTVTTVRDDINRKVTLLFDYMKGASGDTPRIVAVARQDNSGYDLYVLYENETIADVDTEDPSDPHYLCSVFNGADGEPGTGGDEVAWNQLQNTGTPIATIRINDTTQTVYSPNGSGGGITLKFKSTPNNSYTEAVYKVNDIINYFFGATLHYSSETICVQLKDATYFGITQAQAEELMTASSRSPVYMLINHGETSINVYRPSNNFEEYAQCYVIRDTTTTPTRDYALFIAQSYERRKNVITESSDVNVIQAIPAPSEQASIQPLDTNGPVIYNERTEVSVDAYYGLSPVLYCIFIMKNELDDTVYEGSSFVLEVSDGVGIFGDKVVNR